MRAERRKLAMKFHQKILLAAVVALLLTALIQIVLEVVFDRLPHVR